MTRKNTIRKSVSCSGIGLHSGKPVSLTISPAGPFDGIRFIRTDGNLKYPVIHAIYINVCDTQLCTTLSNQAGVKVSTVEHIMAALWGMNIDCATITLDGPEVPIMDGSSDHFISMIESAGIRELPWQRNIVNIERTIEVRSGDSYARLEPNYGKPGLTVDLLIDFEDSIIGKQKVTYDFRQVNFKDTVSRARTFTNLAEVNKLRSMGLALGGSLENAIVVGPNGILNQDGLRYDDEFARHKVLDCLGDLYLLGFRINGHLTVEKPGHKLNNMLVHEIREYCYNTTLISA